MAPAVLACEATLNLKRAPDFLERGVVGNGTDYLQRVYSGDEMSFSTIVFSSQPVLNKKKLVQDTVKSMVLTVSSRVEGSEPKVLVLNEGVLPKLDNRLVFLAYIKTGIEGAVSVDAAGLVKNENCLSVLRFTALKKETRDVALNQFANLIRATQLVK